MPKQKQPIVQAAQTPAVSNGTETITLRNEVKQALRNVLRDASASAAAKASAGRTLLEYFDDTETHANIRRGADMSAAELDHAIALFEKQ